MPEDRELAHAKLTRTLHVVGRRPDGYHLIESEMVTVSLADELSFAPAEHSSVAIVERLDWTGSPEERDRRWFSVPADGTNLVVRALALVGEHAAVRLMKRIPAGGGLGGGSADAAAVLRHFDYRDALGAARLGADVPFCIAGGRAMVSGIGEVIEPTAALEASFVIVTPGFGVSTAAVYACFDELDGRRVPSGDNDLEVAAFTVEPRLATYRDLIASVAGVRPSLAGSGSSMFAETDAANSGALAAALRDVLGSAGLAAVVSEVTCVVPATT